jgi:hypothetical protein
MVRKHYLVSKQFSESQRFSRFGHMVTACGISGVDEGCGEFTEFLSGKEARLEYSEVVSEVTCKRCLRGNTMKAEPK